MLKLSARIEDKGSGHGTINVSVDGRRLPNRFLVPIEHAYEFVALLNAATDLLAVCKSARSLYGHLCLGSLEAAVKYGPDYEPPTDDDWLQMRGALEAAIAKAEGPTT